MSAMNRLVRKTVLLIVIGLVSACSDSSTSMYRELSWKDLKPIDEQNLESGATLNSLALDDDWYTDDYAQSPELRGIYSGAPPQAQSTGVVSEVDGVQVRVPGFVVPLEFESQGLATEFFLVPYFGACFHKPPPAPNQTIYVSSATPVNYQSIYDPVWVMGEIRIEETNSDIARSAYRMELHQLESFE